MADRRVVLVVDDDAGIRLLIRRCLEPMNHEVVEAADGEEALKVFHDRRPDLVIIDLFLPKIMGHEVLSNIRESATASASVPVILISGMSEAARKHFVSMCTHEYGSFINKPFHLSELETTVSRLLPGEPIALGPGPEEDQEVPRKRAVAIGRMVKQAPTAPRAEFQEAEHAVQPELVDTLHRPGRIGVLRPTIIDTSAPHLPPELYGEGTLADILVALYRDRFKGTLCVRCRNQQKKFFFRDGHVVASASNVRGEALGDMLVEQNILTEQQHSNTLKHMMVEKCRYGEALVALGIANHAKVYQYLKAQTRHRILATFQWRGGEYTLYSDAQIPQQVSALELHTVRIVAEGVLSHFPLETIVLELDTMMDRFVHRQVGYKGVFEILRDIEEITVLDEAVDSERMLLDVFQCAGLSMVKFLRGLKVLMITEAITLYTSPQVSSEFSEHERIVTQTEISIAELADEEVSTDPETEDRIFQGYMKIMSSNLFEVMELSEDCSQEAVLKAEKRLLQQWSLRSFTGLSPNLTRKVDEIRERVEFAASVLSDSESRTRYVRNLLSVPNGEGVKVLEAELSYKEGEEKLEENDVEAALQALEKAVELNAREPVYLATMGWASFLRGPEKKETLKNAIWWLKRALVFNPTHAKSFYYLGEIARRVGTYDHAVRYFNRAVSSAPDNEVYKQALKEARAVVG